MGDDVFTRLRAAAPRAFEGEPVLFAYLFGSQATGATHRRSDVDVAVYVEPSFPPDRYLDLRLRLPDRLLGASAVGGIEVAVLNELPLAVRGRALRDGRLIYSRDEPARVRYESLTFREFVDFEIHARKLAEAQLRATAEGRR